MAKLKRIFRDFLGAGKNYERQASSRVMETFQLAQSLQAQGRLDQAAAAFRSILETHPYHWEALKAVAAIAVQNGAIEAAIAIYDGAIARESAHAEAYYKRANALNALGRWEAALADLDRAIALEPAYASAHCNRGVVLERLKRLDAAVASYDRAVALNPGDFLAYYNRGTALKELKRHAEALTSYDRAIELKSDYAEAYINRGNVLQELERHEAAIESYDRAIEITPIFPEAYQARGASLGHLKRFQAAIASYDQAMAIKPDYKFILGMRLNARMQICDWDDLASDIERLADELKARSAVCSPFSTLALLNSAELQQIAAQIWVKEQCPPRDSLAVIAPPTRHDRIRIGYFSADFFRTHPVTLLTAGLFERHDRSRFEITAFAFGRGASDAMGTRIAAAFDTFIDVRDRSDIEIATLARKIGIDIAVDLGGFTEYSRPGIFALRAAPIQVNYLGYPGTMGADYMDYLIADRFLVPATHRAYYSENIVWLPDSFQPNDDRRAIPVPDRPPTEHGLPAGAFVFCCFNDNSKFKPDCFDAWTRILAAVPGSVLWLLATSRTAEDNLRREASQRGLDERRLIFAGRVSYTDYLARYARADLFLDSMPFNGGATASDAIFTGLPLLTCAGDSLASRMAGSILTTLGLSELVTTTLEDYERVAIRLAGDPEHLSVLRGRLLELRAKHAFFDTDRYRQHLEAAYLTMWKRHAAGLAPAAFAVPAIHGSSGATGPGLAPDHIWMDPG